MGTRGVLGFRQNGKDKLTYSHFDSYPSWLGNIVNDSLREVLTDRKRGIKWLEKKVASLKMVEEEIPPTEAQIAKLCKYLNLNVSTESKKDWYCLLRDTQGDFVEILNAGLAIDYSDFILDSLFCEWGYIINLDTKKLEVYKGFQKTTHQKGRYGSSGTVFENQTVMIGEQYYPCALVMEIPFKNLRKRKDSDNCIWVTALQEQLEKKVQNAKVN